MRYGVRDNKGRFSPKDVPLDCYVVAECNQKGQVVEVHAAHIRMSQVISTLQECRQAGCSIRTHKPFTTQRMKDVFRLLRRVGKGYKQVRFAVTGNVV